MSSVKDIKRLLRNCSLLFRCKLEFFETLVSHVSSLPAEEDVYVQKKIYVSVRERGD